MKGRRTVGGGGCQRDEKGMGFTGTRRGYCEINKRELVDKERDTNGERMDGGGRVVFGKMVWLFGEERGFDKVPSWHQLCILMEEGARM